MRQRRRKRSWRGGTAARGVRCGRSSHDLGVFACRDFRRGEVVYAVPRGMFPVITYAQLLRKRRTDDPVQVSPRRYLDWRGPAVRFNHSCAPNVGLTSHPDLRFIALRGIRRGEELRWDYRTSMDRDTECRFTCGCGARECRGVVAGFAHLPAAARRRYARRGVVQQFLLQERRP